MWVCQNLCTFTYCDCGDAERNGLRTYLYFAHLSGAALAALTVSDLLLIHLHGVCTDTDFPSMLPLPKL